MDLLEKCTGKIGNSHIMICCIVLSLKIPTAWNQLGILLITAPTPYTCPNTNKETCPCPNPIYDRSVFTNTATMQWNLICDRLWMENFLQTILQMGVLFGSLIFGIISDRFGRKVGFFGAAMTMTISGLSCTILTNYWTFCFMRIFLGSSIGGVIVISFVTIMEIVPTKYRAIMATVSHLPFNVGHMSIAGMGYFFRNYRDYQLYTSLPAAFVLACTWALPETALWLLASGKTEKAIVVLEKAAKQNGLPRENIPSYVQQFQDLQAKLAPKKGTILDLFRTPNIRRTTICIIATWISCSYSYYGVSHFVTHLSGNILLNVFISGVVGAIGTLVSFPLIKYVNRKKTIIALHLISSLCMFLMAAFSNGYLAVILACAGIMNNFCLFCIAYIYSSELFPTVVRSSGIGACSMFARLGSMIAPFSVGLRHYAKWLTPVVFGIPSLIAAALCVLLPETKGCELMTTLEQAENFSSRRPASGPAPPIIPEGVAPGPSS